MRPLLHRTGFFFVFPPNPLRWVLAGALMKRDAERRLFFLLSFLIMLTGRRARLSGFEPWADTVAAVDGVIPPAGLDVVLAKMLAGFTVVFHIITPIYILYIYHICITSQEKIDMI